MKEIDGQLYGYSYELDATSEEDGTTCFAVDTGTIFFAYSGIWYEQKNAFWQAGGGSSGGGSSLPEVTSDDNGDVLTVVSGAWAKAAPSGGGATVSLIGSTSDPDTETETLDKTWQEIHDLSALGPVFLHSVTEQEAGNYLITAVYQSGLSEWAVCVGEASSDWVFVTDSANGYPSYSDGGGDT